MNNSLGDFPIKTFDDFRNVAQLYQYSRAILTALDLDLFSTLGSRAWPLAKLAGRLKSDARGLDILCRNLAALGLLVKNGSSYKNAPLARTDLNRHSPTYRAEYLDLVKSQWNDFARLTRSVRTGKPPDADQPETPGWRRRFSRAMHHRSRERAARVARTVDLRGVRTLLDVGGGPGTYAMAFLAKNPRLHATVADRPAALQVAREIAKTHPARARLSFAPLDFLRAPISGRYDVVWLSNVIHIYSPAQNLALFRKIRKALTPGGRLIIQDSFLTDPKGLYPIDTTAFALVMLLFTDTGNTYPVRDVMGWMNRAGYRSVHLLTGTGTRKDGENGILEGTTAR